MYSNKKRGRIAGILFLVPLIAYGTGSALIASVTELAHFPAAVPEHSTQWLLGISLLLLNSITVVGIGIVLYPVLRQRSSGIALTYLLTRFGEALLLVIGLIGLLLLSDIGREYGTGGPSYQLEIAANLALRSNYYLYQLAMIVLGIGSVLFCGSLYRSKLVPRSVAVWGISGYVLLAAGAVLELSEVPLGVAFALPGGLFELFLAGWLFVKGFREGQG